MSEMVHKHPLEEHYQRIDRELEEQLQCLLAKKGRGGWLRLMLFFGAGVLFVVALTQSSVNWWLLGLSFFLFALFARVVVLHRRDQRQLERVKRQRRAIAASRHRIHRKWDLLEEAPELSLESAHEVLARDLNLTGEASLMQLLWRPGWDRSPGVLARWMFDPYDPKGLELRHSAIDRWKDRFEDLLHWQSLMPGGQGRDDEKVQGITAALAHLKAWPIWVLVTLNLLTLTGLVLGSLFSWGLALPVMGLNWFLCQFLGRRGLGGLLAVEEALLSLRETSTFLLNTLEPDNRELAEFHGALEALYRKLGWVAVLQSEMIHGPLQALFAWDLWLMHRLKFWSDEHQNALSRGLALLAELEALGCLAQHAAEHPTWCRAEVQNGAPFDAVELGHPLLSDGNVVRNNVKLDHPLMMVSGSNMAGKSTFLRAIGMAVVLSRMGAMVSAKRILHHPYALGTSFRVQDSVVDGVSYFMAELQRLKEVVEEADEHLLFLFDEILLGTNMAERQEAVRRVLIHMIDRGAVGLLSTHDLSVLECSVLKEHLRSVYFDETVGEEEEVKLSFDYRLREGVVPAGNALKLLRYVGVLGEKTPND